MFLYKIDRKEIAYWRKANAIHAWFERNVGDDETIENCRDYYVPKEKLIELRDTCKKVLALSKVATGKVQNGSRYNNETQNFEPIFEDGEYISNSEIAEELLPSKSGFFFGSTDYDQYYLDDLKDTVEQIDHILETTDFDKEEVVYSAWW